MGNKDRGKKKFPAKLNVAKQSASNNVHAGRTSHLSSNMGHGLLAAGAPLASALNAPWLKDAVGGAAGTEGSPVPEGTAAEVAADMHMALGMQTLQHMMAQMDEPTKLLFRVKAAEEFRLWKRIDTENIEVRLDETGEERPQKSASSFQRRKDSLSKALLKLKIDADDKVKSMR
jgi:hypothetical protein